MKSLNVKNLLDEFYKIYYTLIKSKETPDKFRSYHYKKVIDILNKLPQNAKIDEKLINSFDITDKMKMKILNIKKNNIESNNNYSLLNKLTEIKGIGELKAKKLIEEGLTTITQLKNKKWQDKLSEETKLYLQYKPENKIPHEDIKKLNTILRKKIDYDFVIVGSFRRKKEFSRDIDIMLIESTNTQDILNLFLEKLKSITNIYCYSKGSSRLSTIINFNNKFYKLDIFKVKKENAIPMLIYTTGSKEFNIKMRAQAKKLGYLLNQNGLFKNKVKVKLQSEKAYFDILNIKYLKPEER